MNNPPLVSVVMPAYNAGRFVGEAIESVLNQTFSDFELIIINDGSTDETLEVVESYARMDDRVIVITRENKGLVYSRNEGIQRAKGKYIAKMDADDISLPNRFERQIKFMELEKLDICGASIQIFNESNQSSKPCSYPLKDQDIKFSLMFVVPFAQPVVMMKKRIFDSLRYSSSFPCAEDYKLWTDIAKSGFIMGNIDEVLLKYRVHDEQTTNFYNKEMAGLGMKIAAEYRDAILSDDIANLFSRYDYSSAKELRYIYKVLQQKAKEEDVSNEVLARMGMHILSRNKNISIRLYFVYWLFMRRCIKLNMREIQLFIQAALCLTNNSRAYIFFKKYI